MDSICRHGETARQGIGRSVGLVLCAGLLGRAWHHGIAGLLTAPLLVPVVGHAGTRARRWLVATAYFLAGSSGLPAGAATFFGPAPEALLGVSLWIASASLLAAPWIGASDGIGVLVALTLDVLPPLGCIGWLSPLSAAGALYPGTGLWGLALLCALLFSLAARKGSMVILGIVVAVVANIHFLDRSAFPTAPAGWTGVDTHIGPLSQTILDATLKRATWLESVQRKTHDDRVVVLPEMIAGPWWPGTAAQIRAAVPAGQIWLVGATVQAGQRLEDAVMEVRADTLRDTPLFVSPFPVPLSMWRPWSHDSYRAGGWEPVRTVAGRRVWTAICYDQLLPWIWIEALLQKPKVVLAVSNDWWARGTGINAIQTASAWSWTRLMGAALVQAENR